MCVFVIFIWYVEVMNVYLVYNLQVLRTLAYVWSIVSLLRISNVNDILIVFVFAVYYEFKKHHDRSTAFDKSLWVNLHKMDHVIKSNTWKKGSGLLLYKGHIFQSIQTITKPFHRNCQVSSYFTYCFKFVFTARKCT